MKHRAPVVLISGGLLTGCVILGLRFHGPFASAAPNVSLPAVPALAEERFVMGPGRIEPEGGVIRIGAPIDLGASVVSRVLVAEGERVAAGQVLAVLESHDAAEAALRVAVAHRDAMRARLVEARTGTAAVLVRVQEAALAAARVKLEYARRQLARTQPLLAAGDVAAEKNDQSSLDVASDSALLAEAESEKAEAEAAYARGISFAAVDLAEADAAVEQARANLERTLLRAPRAAQVLRIIARPGEQVGLDGMAEIGDTRHLYAVADIYEADAARLRPGGHATISGGGLAAPEPGTVTAIGLITRPRRMEGVDPETARGGRTVEVRVRFGNASAAIVGAEVRVAISLTQPTGVAARLCRACTASNFDVGTK